MKHNHQRYLCGFHVKQQQQPLISTSAQLGRQLKGEVQGLRVRWGSEGETVCGGGALVEVFEFGGAALYQNAVNLQSCSICQPVRSFSLGASLAPIEGTKDLFFKEYLGFLLTDISFV